MDHIPLSGRDFEVDLESGETTREEEAGSPDPVFCGKLAKNALAKVSEDKDTTETKTRKDRRKSTGAKKPPKPPRPPRGLSLDAADQKLIKEIAEIAMLKRARIERMKALKKMKVAKASSSLGNYFAMLFTVLFCFVIIFQAGMSSSNSATVNFHGSPESMEAEKGGIISVKNHQNPSASDTNIPSSGSPNLSGHVSGSHPEAAVSRALG